MVEARYLEAPVREDALALGKMAFVSGPRQVGKTTLARALLRSPHNYFSWDDPVFRRAFGRSPREAVAQRAPGPVVLDEIHKDRRWKTRLKGLYDTQGAADGIIVTASARLDVYRRGGDSLQGRFLPYRLHPFTVAETKRPPGPEEALRARKLRFPVADLLRLGSFPEPLLGGSEARAQRWSRLRLERLLYEDVRDLRAVSDLSGLRMLADFLPERVGSLLSIHALQQDIGAAYGTVKAWLMVFEALYHCFLVRPYARRITRSIRAAPKLYLFDLLAIAKDREAARLENLVALHLRKACDFWTDTAQGKFELCYVRDKEGREVDFLVLREGAPWLLVECKTTDVEPSAALLRFAESLGLRQRFQLVTKPDYDRVYAQTGVRVMSYDAFLAGLV